MQTSPKRARSDEQKLERRSVIFQAAEAHFSEVGFEKFSMATVAKLCGVAKGTLYLYFETREETLLELCLDHLERWQAAFTQIAESWNSDESFSRSFYRSITAQSVLLQLFARLDSVIEHNISLDSFIDTKRHFARVIFEIGRLTALKLKLTEAQSLDVNRSLAALLMGSDQGDLGPNFEDSELPGDIRELMDLFSSEQLFITNVCRIIRGIRMEMP